ncbi:hypothetical protein [Shewanella spartinae]|uniref:hypothetical protein n=1 Tax=Shewanella spartinae TaxID=2864205 RepID=UPI001C657A06|nr:hypothetical protein [Shewanella spartinae]QYJ94788.1 hypothetical protein K0I31_05190 [Shewanella spartinae]
MENKLGSFFVGGHQCYGFVFAGGSVELHFFELPAAIPFCYLNSTRLGILGVVYNHDVKVYLLPAAGSCANTLLARSESIPGCSAKSSMISKAKSVFTPGYPSLRFDVVGKF